MLKSTTLRYEILLILMLYILRFSGEFTYDYSQIVYSLITQILTILPQQVELYGVELILLGPRGPRFASGSYTSALVSINRHLYSILVIYVVADLCRFARGRRRKPNWN